MLEDHVVSGETQIDSDKLRLQMAKLAASASSFAPTPPPPPASPDTSGCGGGRRRSGGDGFEAEFRQLSTLRPHFTIGDCAAGHRNENRGKNRYYYMQ